MTEISPGLDCNQVKFLKTKNLQDAMKEVSKDVLVTHGDRLGETSDREKTHLCSLRHQILALCWLPSKTNTTAHFQHPAKRNPACLQQFPG